MKKILVRALYFLFIFPWLPWQAVRAQEVGLRITGTIRDGLSDEVIPFASVSLARAHRGVVSDAAGYFLLDVPAMTDDTLRVSYVGYNDYVIFISRSMAERANGHQLNLTIALDRGKTVATVVITRTIDRGYLMWKRIVKHKRENDRYRFPNFSYELYNKMELDLNRINPAKIKKIGLLKPFDFVLNNIDTAGGTTFLPVFLTETISDYYYQKTPFKTREIIKASKAEGVNNESVSRLLGGTDANVNTYANFIPVFDKQFVSPLSDNGDKYYHYTVLDSQMVRNRRLIHMSFTPKRKGENTFQGDCWVHDTTWSLQKITLYLTEEANLNFINKLTLLQEFSLVDDSTWFLTKDKFVTDIAPLGKTKFGIIAKKTTTYRNIDINNVAIADSIGENRIKQEVILSRNARIRPDEYWKNARPERLSASEQSIYRMIDTLQSLPVFVRYTNALNFIGTGYAEIGNYEIGPWQNWLYSNALEGLRARWDLATNKGFSRKLVLHGYLAYGFGDRQFEYEADALYLLHKNPRQSLYLKYSKDIDYGQQYLGEVSQDNIFALAVRKPGVPIKFLLTEEKKISYYREWINGFSVTLTASNKAYSLLKNLPPESIYSKQGLYDPLNNTELSVKFRFAYLEKFLENTFYRYSLGSPYPIEEITFSRGVPGWLNSNYSYSKLSGGISDYLKIPPLGTLYYNVFAGKTFGTLPFMLLDVAPGNEIHYYNPYAYNLLNRWELIHDRYAGINIEHDFGNGLFRFIPLTRKLKFRQFWTAKALWGGLSEANKNYNAAVNYPFTEQFSALDGRTYLEIGTGIDNILKVFRLDFIWRATPSVISAVNTGRFGIFFSFRLDF